MPLRNRPELIVPRANIVSVIIPARNESGVIETVPTYRALMVHVEPSTTDMETSLPTSDG